MWGAYRRDSHIRPVHGFAIAGIGRVAFYGYPTSFFHLTAAQSSGQRLRKLDGYVETITSVGQKIKPPRRYQRYVGLWLWIAAKAREADGVWRGSVDDMPLRLLVPTAPTRNIKYPKQAQVTSLRKMEERGWIAIESNTPNPRNRKSMNWSDVAITPIRPPHELALR